MANDIREQSSGTSAGTAAAVSTGNVSAVAEARQISGPRTTEASANIESRSAW